MQIEYLPIHHYLGLKFNQGLIQLARSLQKNASIRTSDDSASILQLNFLQPISL